MCRKFTKKAFRFTLLPFCSVTEPILLFLSSPSLSCLQKTREK